MLRPGLPNVQWTFLGVCPGRGQTHLCPRLQAAQVNAHNNNWRARRELLHVEPASPSPLSSGPLDLDLDPGPRCFPESVRETPGPAQGTPLQWRLAGGDPSRWISHPQLAVRLSSS